MKDNRAVARAGRFVGEEVEHSPFHGMRTLFISRFSCLYAPIPDTCTHVYLAIASNTGFWDRGHSNWKVLLCHIRRILEEHYCVTVDLPPCPELGMFTGIRVDYTAKFCLMITVTVPSPDFGAFCLKAEPKDLYTDQRGSGGVFVAKASEMKYTAWSEYSGDEELS